MSLLTYLRLKIIATFIRFRIPAIPTPDADSVLQIPSRDEGRTIKAYIYKPSNSQPGPSPVLLNFHGSGFTLPLHGSDHLYCRRIAENTPYTVLDCTYRLGPENPFPASPNDVEDAVKYVLSRPEEFDLSHVSIGGFSAGANLSLALSGHVFPAKTFRSVLAFYPPTDASIDPYTRVQPEPGPTNIPPWVVSVFNECYFRGQDPKHPLLSPMYVDAAKFPDNILIITCGQDPLALEGEELAKKLRDGKRHVVSQRMPGVGHAWDKQVEAGGVAEKLRDQAYALAIEMLRR
ncbi:Alpha/Beta hydrolase protein [Rhexocercosporidium sp. MPI-PUGE-AT-0058]|nr:Alpha/Beta hydrolase protein [Rhexocercosporidium sp. MPI-PUGE-AT-0058]